LWKKTNEDEKKFARQDLAELTDKAEVRKRLRNGRQKALNLFFADLLPRFEYNRDVMAKDKV
jgi:hypothetical protein